MIVTPVPLISLAPLLLFGGYLYVFIAYYRRFPHRQIPLLRVLSFAAGCAILAVVLAPPFDALTDRSFAWHMAQHIALILLAPPLLLLGAPLLYIMGTVTRATALTISHALHAQPLSFLLSPIAGWLLFVGVLWVSHFSPLYNIALENPLVHFLEHALYLSAALLFWSHVVDTGLTPDPLSFPVRMLYIFVAIPQGAFLGVALMQTKYALYPHYQRIESALGAMHDQHDAGALMWIAGGLILFLAFMLCAAAWAARERTPEMAR